jgi:hypothetical protein
MAQTTTAPAGNTATAPLNSWLLPVIAAWVIPGAGYFLLKKTGRGALVLASVVLMFLFGIFMRGVMFTPEQGVDYLTSLINYGGFICNVSAGALYFLASIFGYSQPDMAGAVHDYGTKFLVTAGLLNILAIVDTWEIATGKKD